MQLQFQVGQKVRTPSGHIGTIVEVSKISNINGLKTGLGKAKIAYTPANRCEVQAWFGFGNLTKVQLQVVEPEPEPTRGLVVELVNPEVKPKEDSIVPVKDEPADEATMVG